MAQSYALEKGHKNASKEKTEAARRRLYDAIEESEIVYNDAHHGLSEGTTISTVELRSLPNVDFVSQSPSSIAEQELLKVARVQLPVKNIKEARQKVTEFVKTLDLGGGNFLLAEVYQKDGMKAAEIAYNGKITFDEYRAFQNIQWENHFRRV